ncbi:hypothetical protein ACU610_07930 [Geodermatophilus sp. URMC 61]|uniref:hypothetical protein n=1 Tax=Geodermatophilus sp. URMC 61 TaxID=3423411 RepID=UPI00406D0D67
MQVGAPQTQGTSSSGPAIGTPATCSLVAPERMPVEVVQFLDRAVQGSSAFGA